MSIKTILQKWLGVNPQVVYIEPRFVRNGGKPVNFFPELETTSQCSPSNGNIAQKEVRFRKYGKSPKDIRQFYNACGGYSVFSKILKHVDSWYTVNQRTNDTAYPYVLIVFDNDSVSSKGNPESRSFRVKSYEDGHRCALRLLDIHDSQERKRQN